MTWWGKALGGAFGFMIGGPLGALAGVALGHNFDRGLASVDRLPPGGDAAFGVRERTQTAFFTATFAVMGHIAKADGHVSRDEIRLASDLMSQLRLSGELREAAQRLFKEGSADGFPLDAVLEQFRKECHRSSHLIRLFVEIQIQAAYADGQVDAGERRVLERVARGLGLSNAQLRTIEGQVQAELNHRRAGGAQQTAIALEDAYAILNVSASSSDAEVKRAYRRLMSQHHPDKLVAKGLPEEMMKVATEKTQEIKLAYDRVKDARGL